MTKVLENKVAIVTGGASGIGRAVTEHFIKEGASVCAFDLAQDKLIALQEKYAKNVLTFYGDVTKMEDHHQAVNLTVEKFGKIDIYVANAGVFDGFTSLNDIPDDKLDNAYAEIMEVNVKGSLLGIKAAYSALKKSCGNIILTLSSASFYPACGGPLYTVSKHALVGLVRALANEMAPEVRVNGVSPGGTTTKFGVVPSLAGITNGPEDMNEKATRIKRRNPLQIAMEAEDYTSAYTLLASDQGKTMTGTIIESDGGIGVRDVPEKDD